MKYIQFKLGPIRAQICIGKPRGNAIHIHEEGHAYRLPHIGTLDGNIPYSTLRTTPKL